MRIAAIYDIHGNLPALEAVLEEIRRANVDRIVVGGDVFPGSFPRESISSTLAMIWHGLWNAIRSTEYPHRPKTSLHAA